MHALASSLKNCVSLFAPKNCNLLQYRAKPKMIRSVTKRRVRWSDNSVHDVYSMYVREPGKNYSVFTVIKRNDITNGFPQCGGGSDVQEVDCEATGADRAPEVASDDDDDGGDGDGDPDRRRGPSTFSPSFAPALLAFAPLSHYVSFGRSRIYQLISAGEFPKPIKVGKSSRWRKAEIDQWIARQSNQIGG